MIATPEPRKLVLDGLLGGGGRICVQLGMQEPLAAQLHAQPLARPRLGRQLRARYVKNTPCFTAELSPHPPLRLPELKEGSKEDDLGKVAQRGSSYIRCTCSVRGVRIEWAHRTFVRKKH